MKTYEDKTIRELQSEIGHALTELDELVAAKLSWNGGSAKELQKRLKNARDLLDEGEDT